ncbi:hypothetical protein TNCV_3653321 [Trichonephila clavipes]|nr:hypothetical protein TNCV_3653321 [Trichonephila clavipes]
MNTCCVDEHLWVALGYMEVGLLQADPAGEYQIGFQLTQKLYDQLRVMHVKALKCLPVGVEVRRRVAISGVVLVV